MTAIDLALVVETLDGIFSKVAFAIQFMALFTVATGLSCSRARSSRAATSGSARPCSCGPSGATRRQLALIQLVEYAVLGVQAAIVGRLLAVAGNALLARFVFHVPARRSPLGQVAAAVAVVSLLAVATGWRPAGGLWTIRPSRVLRQET